MEIINNTPVNWEEVEDNMVTQWYFVSKIMAQQISGDYPYFTFQGLVEEIRKDPNFKPREDS